MARDEARISTSIWNEASFRALPADAQLLYFQVDTQPDLSRCGLLAWRPGRLAKLCSDMTVPRLRKAVTRLEKSQHVVFDEDYGELFLRTYVRWDRILRLPLMVGHMTRDLAEVASPLIRDAFLIELRRLWDVELAPSERNGLRLALGVDPSALGYKGQIDRLQAAIRSLRPLIDDAVARDVHKPYPADAFEPPRSTERDDDEDPPLDPHEEDHEEDQQDPHGDPHPDAQRGGLTRAHTALTPATALAPTPALAAAADPGGSPTPKDHGGSRSETDDGPTPDQHAQALDLVAGLNGRTTDDERRALAPLVAHGLAGGATREQSAQALAIWATRDAPKPGLYPRLLGDQLRRRTTPVDVRQPTGPPCEHGTPGAGERPERCALCRAGMPADDATTATATEGASR